MDEPAERPAGTKEWENEGGQILPAVPRLPDGIVAVTVTHYLVGPYRYTGLDDALAEHRRQVSPGSPKASLPEV